ncbi:MAG: 8-oxo-dGTP diphosphatase [archaeon]
MPESAREKLMQLTLCLPVRLNEKQILLGMKKRGFGSGKWNGFGGKLKENESLQQAAVRELLEETGLRTSKESLEKVGEFKFGFPKKKEWDQVVHVFVLRDWQGEPQESGEMRPEWFAFSEIPYESMWKDDEIWLPKVLEGKKLRAEFRFSEDNETIEEWKIKELDEF